MTFGDHGQLNNSAIWYEDLTTLRLSNTRTAESWKKRDAAYVRRGKIRQINIPRAAREWVTTDNFTYFRARTTPMADQRIRSTSAFGLSKQSTAEIT